MIFQLAFRGIECIAERDVDVFARVIQTFLSSDDDFLAWRKGYVQRDTIDPALMVMAMRRLDHHGATRDVPVKTLQLRGPLSNACLDGG